MPQQSPRRAMAAPLAIQSAPDSEFECSWEPPGLILETPDPYFKAIWEERTSILSKPIHYIPCHAHHSTPFHSAPCHSIPMHSFPFHSISISISMPVPHHPVPFHTIPFPSTACRSISFPLHCHFASRHSRDSGFRNSGTRCFRDTDLPISWPEIPVCRFSPSF